MEKERILPELLSPAGNPEKARFAMLYGADAIYFSGKSFGMRAAADNFSESEMRDTICLAHSLGKKVYVTLNIMPHNQELPLLDPYLEVLSEIKPDALIVADLGVFSRAQKLAPNIPIHISTQGANVNYLSCNIWYELGAKRVVLARELSLEEIIEIRLKTPKELELEAFVHGAMCVSFSGRCLLSEYYTGRDANRGACTQPCRWVYHFAEEKRPADVLSAEIHPEGSYIFGSKDLCMIDHVEELVNSGIQSLKIEGRMKSAYYAALVTNSYRIALDEYKTHGKVLTNPDLFHAELQAVSHREYSTGYFFHHPMEEPNLAENSGYIGEKSFLATVEGWDSETHEAICRQRNKFSVGENCELITPGKTGIAFVAGKMTNERNEEIPSCPHPQMLFRMKMTIPVKKGDIIRKAVN